jgi:secondary thiamine-phosphate synthase enzyme
MREQAFFMPDNPYHCDKIPKPRDMVRQVDLSLKPRPRGFHLITGEVLEHLSLPSEGILHLFIKHTSAALAINENADPTVLADFESTFNRLVPENAPHYTHTMEGPDDMPAHIKAALIGAAISVPIREAQLYLGVWQGIYLCEFRNRPRPRSLVATLIGI